ncbi:MAG: DUF4032 domain-containing protein [Candidatus Limnocylindrales bacterium]
MVALSIRLRGASAPMLSLPWGRPLADWSHEAVTLRERPVGASRHVVRFVELAGTLYALKEMPVGVARREYETLRELERREFPGVRPLGLVERGGDEPAVLVTEYLAGSFQFRRLFQRLPAGARKHRDRLLDAMAWLMVDLHRNGVYWGDCSLANTLFRRDGQALQAFLVDAETSEVHPSLSDGQRALDVEILVENVAGDLADIGAQIGRPSELIDEDFEAAERVAQRYAALWEELHREETIGPGDQYRVEARVRRLNELGFAVDELSFDPGAEESGSGAGGTEAWPATSPAGEGAAGRLRLRVVVAGRRFHASELRRLTGLEVGEGQATILLNDLRACRGRLERQVGGSVSEAEAADRWLTEIVRPTLARLATLRLATPDPVQAYCDLLEVRWLLSEEAGHDVGDEAAIEAIRQRRMPTESAAGMVVVEEPTAIYDVVGWHPAPPEAAPAAERTDDAG